MYFKLVYFPQQQIDVTDSFYEYKLYLYVLTAVNF